MTSKSRTTRVIAGLALAAIALAGCSNAPEGGDGKTLTVASTSGNQASMDAATRAFEEDNPGVQVNVSYSGTEQFQSTIRTQLSSGTGPDVFTVWAGSGNAGAIETLQGAGYLADLSDSPWVEQVPTNVADQLQIDGKTYGLPSKLDVIGAIYNKKTLDEVGAKIPTTWDELLTFCSDVKSKGKTPFALGLQTPWTAQLIAYSLVGGSVYADTPKFDEQLADGSATFAGSAWQDALSKYLEMDAAGCFTEQPLGTTVEATYDQLSKGDAVATVQVIASLAQIEAVAAEGTEFGIFALPSDNSGKIQTPTGIGVSFALNEKATNKDLGGQFIDFLGSEEGLRVWAEAGESLPVITLDDHQLSPVLETSAELISAGNTSPFPDQHWPSARVQDAMLTGIQKMFSDQAAPNDVLTSMDSAYSAG